MGAKTPAVANEIKAYLNEIAERLWSRHAAVMVGAGFSMNTKADSTSRKLFPTWNQLGDSFYEKIHGKLPSNDERYLNAIKLADEVQAAYGRPALNQVLLSNIPDDEHEPSQLHTDLLELPWVDVFTTNYDTLLERARINVQSQKFDLVVNKEDLVYSEKPRIIKLHGSFPSHRPFIITEEDYRTYPKEFAPFVNTVQQSLLENTLCLIGFSGDDPNFLQWIGWIRDNLGKDNAPKIFLIGIFNLSDAQKKLLEQRNIVIIDMSICSNINKSEYAKALDVFFKYLSSKKKEDNKFEGAFEKPLIRQELDKADTQQSQDIINERKSDSKLKWPFKQQFMQRELHGDDIQQLIDVINEWKDKRESYPNWAILPEDLRKSLWIHTESWLNMLSCCNKLKTPLDIEFLYEIDWRTKKCLYPIFNDNIDIYKSIIEKYNPYPNILTLETALVLRNDEAHKDLNWKEIEVKWLELHISMMRFYREEGCHKKWDVINTRIENLYSNLSPELIANLHYERCLYALFTLDVFSVREQIKLWPSNESLPFWEAKRAGLIAELGDIDKSEKILEKSLSSIRAQLNLAPVSDDYTWVSKEAIVMLLLQDIKSAKSFAAGEWNEIEEIRGKFNDRWNYLRRHKCDPRLELKLFGISLERKPVYTPETSKKYEFDIGRITSTHHLGHRDTEALTAYSFLRYCEDAGIPFRVPGLQIGTKLAVGAVKRIRNHAPYWSLATFLRAGETKAADAVFSRKTINKRNINQIDNQIDEYLRVLQSVKAEIEKADNFSILLAKSIPEILSRLCVKCSTDAKDKLLDFLKDIYSSEYKHKYKGISNLVERLIRSYSTSELYFKLPMLLEFPILKNLNVITKTDYPEPFFHISINEKSVAEYKDISIEKAIISRLLLKVGSKDPDERIRAIFRVVKLHELDLLSNEQIELFAEAIWSQTDEIGFPENTSHYKFAFLDTLPSPEHISPELLFKDYISEGGIQIQKTREEKGIPITDGNIPFIYELVGGTKTHLRNKGIDWSEKEINDIFEYFLEWWDADKEYIHATKTMGFSGSIGDEFKKRFINLVWTLNCVIIPRLSPQSMMKKELSRLLKEFQAYGIPCVSAQASSLVVFPAQKHNVFDNIGISILSKQQEVMHDGYEAIKQLFILHDTKRIVEIPTKMWSYIVSPIKWRCALSLIEAMKTMIYILDYFPENITENFLSDIISSMGYLIDETDLQNQQSDDDIADSLATRSIAVSLAYRLYRYYITRDLPIPEILMKWEAICNDVEEFSDIRNRWKN